MRVLLLLVFISPFFVNAQRFPSPPSQSQINNHMMRQHNSMMQHQQMMNMMKTNIISEEYKLEYEESKKISIENNIIVLNFDLKDIEKELLELSNDDNSDENKIKKFEKLIKKKNKTQSKLNKNIEKLEVTIKKIKEITASIESSKKELEEKEKNKKEEKEN